MKRTLLFSTLALSLNAFAQNNNLDFNGLPLNHQPVIGKVETSAPISPAAITYENVRALSEINDASNADAYPWISGDGLRLYFTRGGSVNKIMTSKRNNISSNFEAPTMVTTSVSNPGSSWLSPNELDIYITSGGSLYHATRPSLTDPFGTAVIMSLGTTYSFIAGVSLNATQDELFLYDGTGIHQFSRASATSFTFVRSITLPTGYTPGPGHLAKDGLTYFLNAVGNGQSTLNQLSRSTLSAAFDATTMEQLQGINDIAIMNSQPTMSNNLDYVVFVRNSTNTWDGNELYLASRQGLSSIKKVESNSIFSVYPNPSTGLVSIKLKDEANNNNPLVIEVVNTLGEIVLSQNKLEIDLTNMPKGIYSIKVSHSKSIQIEKIIVQ